MNRVNILFTVTDKKGRFITDLAAKFSNAVVADIFAYLKLHTELVLTTVRKADGTPSQRNADTSMMIYSTTKTPG